MGRSEFLRFDVDPDTSGLWEQVKGDLHRKTGSRVGNGPALRLVARIYLELSRRDKAGIDRIIDRLKLEDGGFESQ